MIRKFIIIISAAFISSLTGCVKETYDMNKLSKKAHLSPTFGVSAVQGDISLSDLIDQNDTVVFDENNFIKIIFKEDSVINFTLDDYYDLSDMVSFNQSYTIGEMSLAPFTGTIDFSLDDISQHFEASLRSQFVALDGTTGDFPSFPSTDMGETMYSLFTNFENAEFSQGALDIFVTNNLTAPLYGVSVTLFNAAGHVQIGNEAVISAIDAGETGTASIDLANMTLSNSIIAAVVINGSPGATNVPIDLSNDNIDITVAGRDLLVRSGRVVLPTQTISTLDDHDTVSFDPGTDVEIELIKMNTGDLTYTIHNGTPLSSDISLTLPTAKTGVIPISVALTVDPDVTLNGTLPVDNSLIDLGSITSQPYNLMPVDYSIDVSSGGTLIDFDSSDEISLEFSLTDPDFDYVKGYFGEENETIDPDTLDLDIKDVLDHITGTMLLSSPSIKLNYFNSFAIPIEVNLQATGFKGSETVDLNMDSNPFPLSYPAAPEERDKEDIFVVDKINSSLPELVSMPPEKVSFSGSVAMNPDGNDGTRDNYIFGDSRFLGNLEIEVPMEFRINNLQFADTVDNFLKNDDPDEDSPLNWEDFDFLKIKISASNGFPVGVSLSLSLYDSGTNSIKNKIDADKILEPAPVDGNGRVTEPVDYETSIEITKEFWQSIDKADRIIFTFTVVTTNNGSEDVKIYSDYKIDFKASIILKPDLQFDM